MVQIESMSMGRGIAQGEMLDLNLRGGCLKLVCGNKAHLGSRGRFDTVCLFPLACLHALRAQEYNADFRMNQTVT